VRNSGHQIPKQCHLHSDQTHMQVSNPYNLVYTPNRYRGSKTDEVVCILDRFTSAKSTKSDYTFSFLHRTISDKTDCIVCNPDQPKGVKTGQTVFSLRDAFKKRLTFLNIAPTNIDSPLRLLGAPSVRFWQQTAICPVSLWTLVVELHPLNSARELTVRRISDKVTMKEL
jgi:hypothetical protein